MDPSSKSRLTPSQAHLFAGSTLLDGVGRAVCAAGVLPRKELFESFAVARQVRRVFRGGRVVDLCCGHGLLAQLMILLDDSSPTAVAVDTLVTPSAHKVAAALVAQWPRLAGRVGFASVSLETFELHPDDVVVSAHACGHLTDVVLTRAAAVGARVAVLPCCHHLHRDRAQDLEGWLDGVLAMDVERAVWLRARGYRVKTTTIAADITPHHRLLLGTPERLA